jgi:hypothetical protein
MGTMKRIATSKDQLFEMRLSSGFGPEDDSNPFKPMNDQDEDWVNYAIKVNQYGEENTVETGNDFIRTVFDIFMSKFDDYRADEYTLVITPDQAESSAQLPYSMDDFHSDEIDANPENRMSSVKQSASVSIPWDVANRILGLLAGYKHSKGYDAERSGMDSDTSDIDEMSEILKQAMFPEEEPYMESGGLPGWER